MISTMSVYFLKTTRPKKKSYRLLMFCARAFYFIGVLHKVRLSPDTFEITESEQKSNKYDQIFQFQSKLSVLEFEN